ncbi:MAG: ABC transporter permease subunit [Coleofasciculaceae cyanobacterium SM2_1_6]|nr:ABC transporter permease subunit [Coleofasciculaceae cyanobacterium SM2_1_6]
MSSILKSSPKTPFNLRGQAWLLRSYPYLLLLPALSVIALLFGGGLVLALLQSLGLLGVGGDGHLTLAAYQQALSHPEFLRALGLSLYTAIMATGLSVMGSIGLALLLRSTGRWASLACQITLPIPHLVGVVGILLLLTPSGLVSRILYAIGWIQSDQDFPLLVNDGANLGVLLHFLWKEIPFMTLILLAVLRGIDREYETQARVLGASPWQCFWHVTLPLMKPGILSASLIVFGFIFGSFEVPFLLGSTFPRTLPVLVYRTFTNVDLTQRPTAIALGLILSLCSTFMIMVYLWLTSDSPNSPNQNTKVRRS